MAWADVRDTDLLLDPTEAILEGRRLKFPLAKKTYTYEEKQQGLLKPLDERVLPPANWEYVYVKYDEAATQSIYQQYQINPDHDADAHSARPKTSPFSHKTRLRLIYEK